MCKYLFCHMVYFHIIEDLLLNCILIHWPFSPYHFMLFCIFSYGVNRISQYILISVIARFSAACGQYGLFLTLFFVNFKPAEIGFCKQRMQGILLFPLQDLQEVAFVSTIIMVFPWVPGVHRTRAEHRGVPAVFGERRTGCVQSSGNGPGIRGA